MTKLIKKGAILPTAYSGDLEILTDGLGLTQRCKFVNTGEVYTFTNSNILGGTCRDYTISYRSSGAIMDVPGESDSDIYRKWSGIIQDDDDKYYKPWSKYSAFKEWYYSRYGDNKKLQCLTFPFFANLSFISPSNTFYLPLRYARMFYLKKADSNELGVNGVSKTYNFESSGMYSSSVTVHGKTERIYSSDLSYLQGWYVTTKRDMILEVLEDPSLDFYIDPMLIEGLRDINLSSIHIT